VRAGRRWCWARWGLSPIFFFGWSACRVDKPCWWRPSSRCRCSKRCGCVRGKYPQAVRTGSSKTSWQMLHLRCRLIFSGYRNSRLDLRWNLCSRACIRLL
jgi:hypothetical protein